MLAAVLTPIGRARSFLSWWRDGLAACVPWRWRARLAAEGWPLVLDLAGPDGAVVVEDGVTGARTTVGSRNDPLAAAELERRLAALARGSTNLTLRLDPARMFSRVVRLPEEAGGSIDQVLRFEMDRLTPFAADEVQLGWRAVGRDPARRQIEVAFTVIPREEVAAAVAMARRWGLNPAAVELWPGPGGHLRLRGPTARARRIRLAEAGVLAVLLALLASLAWVQRDGQVQRLDALEEAVAEARAGADAAQSLRAQLDLAVEQANRAVARKLAAPMTVQVLTELARALPDHSWMTQLSITGDDVDIVGYSRAVTEVVAGLSASGAFQDVTFRSPVTKDEATGGLERFHLGARLAGEPAS
ncbi:MAG: PilN domain-containing protein [Geminicoccaceae bacterium]